MIADAAFDALKAVREQSETVRHLAEIIQGPPTRPEDGLLWRMLAQEQRDIERARQRRFLAQLAIVVLGGLCLALVAWVARLYQRFP